MSETQALGGVDFSQYRNWRVVRTPSGGTYYQVPNSAFVYDPFTSAAKGKPVLFRNPQPRLDEEQRVKDMQEDAANPLNQLVPVVGSVGGLVAGKYAIDALSSAPEVANTAAGAANAAGALGSAASGAGAASGAAGAVSGAVPAAPSLVSATALPAAEATTAVGRGLQSLGVGAQTASTLGQYVLPGIGAGLGAYNIYNELQKGDLSEGEGAFSGASVGAGIGTMIAPGIGTAIGAGVGALGGLVAGMFNHKSTKQYQKERWGKLQEKGVIGAEQAKALNHPEGDDQTWDDGKYAGQKWTMERALDLVKDDPRHFHHVYGNYKTFGNDWSNYTEQQKSAIVSRLAQEGLYKSDKGDVLISNEDQARKIKDEILGGVVKPEAEMGKKLADKANNRRR